MIKQGLNDARKKITLLRFNDSAKSRRRRRRARPRTKGILPVSAVE